MLQKQRQNAKVVFSVSRQVLLGMEKAIQHFTIDIELHLGGRAVANSHRTRAFIAEKPARFPFHQLPLAFKPVHDLDLVGASRHRAQQPVLPGRGLS